MTPEQKVIALRQDLALNEDLANLLAEVAKQMADAELRQSYKTVDASILIRQAGIAEGIEKFVTEITKAPRARSDKTGRQTRN